MALLASKTENQRTAGTALLSARNTKRETDFLKKSMSPKKKKLEIRNDITGTVYPADFMSAQPGSWTRCRMRLDAVHPEEIELCEDALNGCSLQFCAL
jgi:hypothetical protein